MAQGWYRYKLSRELTPEEAKSLRGLAGPVYQKWSRMVIAHENCAWLFEKWLSVTPGLSGACVGKPDIVERIGSLPQLEVLREWVPQFLAPFQLQFLLQHGHQDGAFLITGTGCLAGDTELVINRGGNARRFSLWEVVHKFNGGMLPGSKGAMRGWDPSIPSMTQSVVDGALRLNRIVAAHDTGMKEVWRVTTTSGHGLTATADHRFLTPTGFKKLSELAVGDAVMAEVWPEAGDAPRQPKRKYRYVRGLAAHPYAGRTQVQRRAGVDGYTRDFVEPVHRVLQHRLVVEAEMNNLPYDAFITRVRTGSVEGLTFLPLTYHVHHHDENTLNNTRENLEVLTGTAHHQHHAREGHWRHVMGRAEPVKITTITPAGVAHTYDLTMESPHNNYVANGLVVHNSGKSVMSVLYGLLHGGRICIVTRAGARRTLAGEVRKFTTLEPFVLEITGQQIPEGTRVVVVGWESLQSHKGAVLAWGPTNLVLDESHVASNHKRREAVVARNESAAEGERDNAGRQVLSFRKLHNRFAAAEDLSRAATYRVAATATPIRDRLRNLWSQIDLIIPKGIGYFYDYARRYCGSHVNPFGGINTNGRGSDVEIAELVSRLSFFTYYVPQSVTHRDLPPKRRQVTYIPQSELDSGKDVLKELKEHGFQSAVGEVWSKLAHAAAMKRSRVIEEAVNGAYKDASGAGGGKVVVFTGLRKDCEKIAAGVRKAAPDLTVFTAHGGSTPQERDVIREAYMAHPGPCVLVGTGDSWGESLSLHDTDLAIIAMLPWTPGQIRQWEGRFSRLGMKRPVLIMYLVAEGTADEHVAHALLTKLPAVEAVAKDEVLAEFAVDLRGDEEAVAASLWSKITTDDEDEGEDDNE